MAEVNPTISVDDPFVLGANFSAQESATADADDFVEWYGSTGNYVGSVANDDRTELTSRMKYINATPDLDTDLTLLETFGDLFTAGVVTQCVISFVAGERCDVALDGHQHTTNAHAESTLDTFDCTGIIPASSGLGVPDLITVTGDCSPVSAELTFAVEHLDKIGATGDHFSSANLRCRVDLSVEYEGHVAGFTAGDWLEIKVELSKPNDAMPTSRLTAHQYIDKTIEA